MLSSLFFFLDITVTFLSKIVFTCIYTANINKVSQIKCLLFVTMGGI